MFSARNRRAEDNGCGITMAAVPYSIHPSRNVVCVFYLFFFFFLKGDGSMGMEGGMIILFPG